MIETFPKNWFKLDLQDQVGGTHYLDFKIQPVEFIMANELGFCEGNVIKYVCRYQRKNGLDDLLKAKQYLEFLIKKVEAENE